MPAIYKVPTPEAFSSLNIDSASFNEANDCAVIAVAAFTGQPYHVVHKLMLKNGRVPRMGTKPHVTDKTLRDLDCPVFTPMMALSHIRAKYPRRTKVKGMTSHHPRRFPESFVGCPDMLLRTEGHIAAMVQGVVQDYSINKVLRVKMVMVRESDREMWIEYIESNRQPIRIQL